MAFGLTIGTERATALQVSLYRLFVFSMLTFYQNSIQNELTKREYSADAGG